MGFLSRAIRQAREERHWSQAELATQVKVSQATISFWENGVEEPSLMHYVNLLETMPEILKALSEQELALLDRLQQLERLVFDGGCGCTGCDCSAETPVTKISDYVKSGSK
jgi:transcriptional regulator with XRE-family HTH domain